MFPIMCLSKKASNFSIKRLFLVAGAGLPRTLGGPFGGSSTKKSQLAMLRMTSAFFISSHFESKLSMF